MTKKYNSSYYVKKWRVNFKERVVKAFDGKCCVCGYDKYVGSFDLHHLDPSKKEFTLGKIIARAINWNKVCNELRKCVLVCANCHREVHAGVSKVPEDAARFNEEYSDYRKLGKFDKCPVCNDDKPICNKTCSYECAAKKSNKILWPKNLPDLVMKTSKLEVARQLGVSDVAVAKRLRKHHKAVKS